MTLKHSQLFGAAIAIASAFIFGHVAICSAQDGAAEDVQLQLDLSTAKSASLAWIDACWSGNAHAAHKILVDDEQQRKFMTGMLQFSAALRALELASIKRFGEAGRRVTGYPDGSAKAVEKKLEVSQQDDRATASSGEAIFPLELRRIDGQWRVDVSKLSRDPRAQRAAELSKAAAKTAGDVAAEIAQGKYDTAVEAAAAFRERRLGKAKD